MIICSKCGTGFNNPLIITKAEALLKPLDDIVMEAVTGEVKAFAKRKELFEAAVGTLTMVVKEVPELQAAKIQAAINVLTTIVL